MRDSLKFVYNEGGLTGQELINQVENMVETLLTNSSGKGLPQNPSKYQFCVVEGENNSASKLYYVDHQYNPILLLSEGKLNTDIIPADKLLPAVLPIEKGGTDATNVRTAVQNLFPTGNIDPEFFIVIDTNWQNSGYCTPGQAAAILSKEDSLYPKKAIMADTLRDAPSISASGNQIAVTAGSKASSPFTVPFATTSSKVNVNTNTDAVLVSATGSSDSFNIIYRIPQNDQAYIEFATGDNALQGGAESFVFSQYSSIDASGTPVRQLTLLDSNGNTIIPGTLSAAKEITSSTNMQAPRFFAGKADANTVGANLIPSGGYLFYNDGSNDTGIVSTVVGGTSADGNVTIICNGKKVLVAHPNHIDLNAATRINGYYIDVVQSMPQTPRDDTIYFVTGTPVEDAYTPLPNMSVSTEITFDETNEGEYGEYNVARLYLGEFDSRYDTVVGQIIKNDMHESFNIDICDSNGFFQVSPVSPNMTIVFSTQQSELYDNTYTVEYQLIDTGR